MGFIEPREFHKVTGWDQRTVRCAIAVISDGARDFRAIAETQIDALELGPMRFSEKVAVITGSGRGIGLACARRFAREGAKVVIAEIDEACGKDAEDEIISNGGDALFVHVDVGERLDVHNMLAATLDTYGRIDVLINNAGVSVGADFLELSEQEFDRVIKVNLKAAFLVSQSVGRQMAKQIEAEGGPSREGSGYTIINMSSVGAVTSSGDSVAYAASKAGLNQLTRAMALALAPLGIRVNAIGPGNINSGVLKSVRSDAEARDKIIARTPLGRIGDPDEIASIAAFLASEDAAYVTGQCIYADGGRLALSYTVEAGGAD